MLLLKFLSGGRILPKERLDILLVKSGCFDSREQARRAIMAGLVCVNGELEDKPGKKYYIWFVIDSETRFVISFHLSPYRSSPQAFSLFGNAGKYGTPNAVVTDRYWPYNTAVKVFFPNSKHIKVQSFKDDISNNIIESFNDTFKSWYKSKRGFGSFTSANNLIATFIFFYNFIRPHSSLNNLAPAQVAGANYNDKDRCNWILTA
jgi:transposase InsO family protein